MVVTGTGFATGVLGPNPNPITDGWDSGPQFPPLENGLMTVPAWWAGVRRQRAWFPAEAPTMWVLRSYLKYDQVWIFPETPP